MNKPAIAVCAGHSPMGEAIRDECERCGVTVWRRPCSCGFSIVLCDECIEMVLLGRRQEVQLAER